MKRLLKAIWHLGIRLGWRYWKIENRCIENPELVKQWAFDCRTLAVDYRDEDMFHESAMRKILWDWASKLEESYLKYTMNNRNQMAVGEQITVSKNGVDITGTITDLKHTPARESQSGWPETSITVQPAQAKSMVAARERRKQSK